MEASHIWNLGTHPAACSYRTRLILSVFRGICILGSVTLTRYRGPVSNPRVPGGVVHKLPGDLRKALIANPMALDAWNDITPLARNEFICWVEDAKQQMTRERRIRRTQEELEEGQRRPCCWPGCKHRERTGMEQAAGASSRRL
jgi:Bacteriocin-protection, YdeI or OmpD-Associated